MSWQVFPLLILVLMGWVSTASLMPKASSSPVRHPVHQRITDYSPMWSVAAM